jgi:DNA topoisomerase-3
VWKEIAAKKLTQRQVTGLISKGKTRLIKGFKNKAGKKFNARLTLDEQSKVRFEFD